MSIPYSSSSFQPPPSSHQLPVELEVWLEQLRTDPRLKQLVRAYPPRPLSAWRPGKKAPSSEEQADKWKYDSGYRAGEAAVLGWLLGFNLVHLGDEDDG